MRRALCVLLVLVIAVTAFAAPGISCVPTTDGVGAARHHCCDEPALNPIPVGTCCVVSAPVQRTGNTESRLVAPEQVAVVLPRTMADGFPQLDVGLDPAPPVRPATVPLYLQQLSLLI